jgi:hypothetical protein
MPGPPENYSEKTILDQPEVAARILPIQGGGGPRTRSMAEAEAAAKAAAKAAAEAEAKLKAKAGAKLKPTTNVESVTTEERGSEGGSEGSEGGSEGSEGGSEEEDEDEDEEDEENGASSVANEDSVSPLTNEASEGNKGPEGNQGPEPNKGPVANSKVNVTVGPKTVKLMKGFRVRLPEKYKDEIMNLDFTEEEQRLFNDYLKFNKPFIINYIKESEESKQEFYDFWKLFVEKDGTDGFTLMTKLEGRKIQKYMEDIVYAHREYLIQSALRVLRKQDNPQQFEDLLTPPEEDGFLFTTVGVGAAAVAPLANAAEEEDDEEYGENDLARNEATEKAEEEEAEEDEYEEEKEDKKAPAEDKFKDFKELRKMLNGREGNEVKLNNVINYLTTSFPKDKYPKFKTLMAVKTGSHFDVGHPRVNLESFFDLYREERDTLSFASLLNLLIRIKIDSIKDVNLRDSFKEFFTSHIYNDVNGVKYRDRVELYIQGKY